MSENLNRDEIIKHYEEVIKKIKDIVSAKIITNPDGKISEIHVLANSNRNPKQIVRDIESALVATFGSEIDHKKISVAQLNKEELYVAESRLKIDSIDVKKTNYSYEITVTLKCTDGKVYEGRASGAGSYKYFLRLVALAAIDAIQQYLSKNFIISLEDINIFRIGDKEAIAVLISILMDGSEESFLGTALFRQDKAESVVLAVLNAVNRRISFLVKEKND
ncbi:alpha-isopropylmalate synthase regulatory domain-containing protein [Thermosediminibacter litoriperuensis]|uniref:LeuA-like protein with dimerization domain n=1 Tax=Thermosediminibacter litoriperuensis TaxID=291989 RepID=A0A5S5AYH0_9FIRM|nr:alpha-isopropylmalate synthase regulatory domain-containing protein [Thermosediminibacter litoriperuensis]TYP57826.1 LeuA-like protein with dimerization domain [Thermosediminibacter litoriperuensis]